MSEWMGVTVSGTPQRVTALDLPDLGLDGQLSGLVGNLTGLMTLDLSGNRLTGMLPSKLAVLTNLTTVSLSGTSFTGCAPPVLRRVTTNDITVTDLDDCVAYTDLRSTTSREELPSGTYSITGHATSGPALVFDIPEGASFRVRGVQLAERIKPHAGAKSIGNRALVLESADGESAIGLDLEFAGDYGRIVDPDLSEAQQQALNDLMDLIIDSSWIQE